MTIVRSKDRMSEALHDFVVEAWMAQSFGHSEWEVEHAAWLRIYFGPKSEGSKIFRPIGVLFLLRADDRLLRDYDLDELHAHGIDVVTDDGVPIRVKPDQHYAVWVFKEHAFVGWSGKYADFSAAQFERYESMPNYDYAQFRLDGEGNWVCDVANNYTQINAAREAAKL